MAAEKAAIFFAFPLRIPIKPGHVQGSMTVRGTPA
jgi:hypothetical protein